MNDFITRPGLGEFAGFLLGVAHVHRGVGHDPLDPLPRAWGVLLGVLEVGPRVPEVVQRGPVRPAGFGADIGGLAVALDGLGGGVDRGLVGDLCTPRERGLFADAAHGLHQLVERPRGISSGVAHPLDAAGRVSRSAVEILSREPGL